MLKKSLRSFPISDYLGMNMGLIKKLKIKYGACPSCYSFVRERKIEKSYERPFELFNEKEELTPYSEECNNCRHQFGKGKLSDITVSEESEVIEGDIGWGTNYVITYYKKGKKIGEDSHFVCGDKR